MNITIPPSDNDQDDDDDDNYNDGGRINKRG